MIKESFLQIDALAQREKVFSGVDARLKIGMTAMAIILILAMPGVKFPLLILATTMLTFFLMQIPMKTVLLRLMLPGVLCAVVIILDTFLIGPTFLFKIHIGNWLLAGYQEGFSAGMHIAVRAISSISLIMFMSFSTPVNELMLAVIWYKIPKLLVEIFMLTYRYLFVIWEEGSRIHQAQLQRLGYPNWKKISNWKKAMKSTSTLLGMVLIRAYDRAESTYNAMLVRGYKGDIIAHNKTKWSLVQWKYAAFGFSFISLLVLISSR